MKKVRSIHFAIGVALFSIAVTSGCRSALPAPQPEKEFTKSAGDAFSAAERASAAAADCRTELSRSEQLLAEMRVLASRARDAELRCEASRQAAVKKAKTPIIRRQGTPKKAVEAVVVQKPVEAPKPAEPEYSPSDAPIPAPISKAPASAASATPAATPAGATSVAAPAAH